jgi:NAD(P)-dependent dehydrogenase (short-subunit alcohol dehydrogenase family)
MQDVALVCGGSGALGSAVVRAFLARGDVVISAGRRAAAVVPTREPERLRSEIVDLTEPDEVEALWERLADEGALPRWLVNAVGGFRGGTVAETDADDYRLLQQINLDATWWSCRAAARRLSSGAAIVNVSARPALAGGTGAAAYAVSKAAVLRLTQVLSGELRERRVRVNAVLPSVMDTPGNRAAIASERMRDSIPTDDVAAVVAFLCSDQARVISGAAIPVYGWA